jgi:hypothetical protein
VSYNLRLSISRPDKKGLIAMHDGNILSADQCERPAQRQW